MTFRRRLVIGGLAVAWLPVLCMGLLVRFVGVARLAEATDRRMLERGDQLAGAWEEEARRLEGNLDILRRLMVEDNDVRIAVRSGQGATLQQAVARFASSSGVEVAYVLDAAGTILAASHFPGDAGRGEPGLAALAEIPEGPVVGLVSFPGSDVTAVMEAGRVDVGGLGVVAIVGVGLAGVGAMVAGEGMSLLAVSAEEAGDGVLQPEQRTIAQPANAPSDRAEIRGRRSIARVFWQGWDGSPEPVPVDLVIAWRDPLLAVMVRSYDQALLFSLLGAAILALVLGRVMARRLSDPVEKLAATARRVHLGRLDTTFGRGGGRELDRLGFFLNGMMNRIREGVVKVRDAEKRATVGELARQVNHDVRNGLVPIGNVMKHLGEAHRSGPETLAEVFEARAPTLVESLDYLGDLADQYRDVAVHGVRERSELRAVARSVVESNVARPPGVRVVGKPGSGSAWVEMDGVSLRRVVENVVANAVTAVTAEGGEVRVSVEAVARAGRPCYRLTVSDDGPGIPAEVRARVFEPFFTTRPEGTGLGLAISRRLVQDVGGKIVLESWDGGGTRVDVVLNASSPAEVLPLPEPEHDPR